MITRLRWGFIRHEGHDLFDIGVLEDGSLHNPNNYDEALVRAAIAVEQEADRQARAQLEQLLEERRRRAAQRGVATRARRRKLRVEQIVKAMLAASPVGPRDRCAICGRGLSDPESVERGVGSECWGTIKLHVELAQRKEAVA